MDLGVEPLFQLFFEIFFIKIIVIPNLNHDILTLMYKKKKKKLTSLLNSFENPNLIIFLHLSLLSKLNKSFLFFSLLNSFALMILERENVRLPLCVWVGCYLKTSTDPMKIQVESGAAWGGKKRRS